MVGVLEGKRFLVTCSRSFMGPAIAERFTTEGAHVIADDEDLTHPTAASRVVRNAGPIDGLIVNLESRADVVRATEIDDDGWLRAFEELVHPTMRLIRSALPEMLERHRGKIVVITSATSLRPIAPMHPYVIARGAQNVLVQQVGIEVARHGVNVNAIAQNFVSNPAYFPDGVLDDPVMGPWIRRHNPSGRLATGTESADLAVFLASDRSDFFYGQVFPFAGGSAINV